jgi:hypothetical protein
LDGCLGLGFNLLSRRQSQLNPALPRARKGEDDTARLSSLIHMKDEAKREFVLALFVSGKAYGGRGSIRVRFASLNS